MNTDEFLRRVSGLAGSQRLDTFCALARIALDRKLNRIVETGCYRGIDADGNSTIILSMIAARLGGSLDSVDINPEHVEAAKRHTPITEGPTLAFHLSDSVEYLHKRTKPVDVLYLDSLDFNPDDPGPSQRHQLLELLAAEPLLSPASLVLLDDFALKDRGKTLLSSERLRQGGWRLLASGYQLLWGRGL